MRRLALLPLVVLAGCGTPATASGRPDAPVHVQVAGHLALDVPAGWSLATKLTALAEPRERFTLSSGRLPSGPQNGCGPAEALRHLGADDVLAFVIEYSHRPRGARARFPPRGQALAQPLPTVAEAECLGRGSLLSFRVNGRVFQVAIVVGADAPRPRLAALLGALRHMRVGRSGA